MNKFHSPRTDAFLIHSKRVQTGAEWLNISDDFSSLWLEMCNDERADDGWLGAAR